METNDEQLKRLADEIEVLTGNLAYKVDVETELKLFLLETKAQLSTLEEMVCIVAAKFSFSQRTLRSRLPF